MNCHRRQEVGNRRRDSGTCPGARADGSGTEYIVSGRRRGGHSRTEYIVLAGWPGGRSGTAEYLVSGGRPGGRSEAMQGTSVGCSGGRSWTEHWGAALSPGRDARARKSDAGTDVTSAGSLRRGTGTGAEP
ncbi:unnamed protein product [Pleuronectes platessa]|uniref:Uncharacterized protein n=1 Tax=Pleuronectes platessa TaxID=8262 RepID=A0A9N7UFW9_PLEPL|nr:unnamed protein product [Pleuronectes platessa]